MAIKLNFDGGSFTTGFSVDISDAINKIEELGRTGLPEQQMKDIAEYLQRSIREKTLSGVDAEGQPFQAYADTYKKYPRQPDLYDTGSALDGMYIEDSGESLYVTTKPYMTYHQEGTDKMPRRKFAPDAEDLESGAHTDVGQYIERVVEEYIERILDLG